MSSPIQVIDAVHVHTHEGSLYTVSHRFESIADNTSVYLHIKTAAGRNNHTNFSITASGYCDVFLYESPTLSSNGTAKTIYNNNRSSTKTSSTLAYYSPTVSAVGTELFTTLLPGGSGFVTVGASGGSPVRGGTEWIFDQSRSYLISGKNTSGAAADITISVSWYETGDYNPST